MLAATGSVPWWSLPTLAAALLVLFAYRREGKSVTDAGLAGSRAPLGAIRRGQSARSVAEMAANAAIAMQTQVELQQTEIDGLKKTINGLNDTIALLRKDNDRLERLVTQTSWGEALTKKIDANHAETLAALAEIGVGR